MMIRILCLLACVLATGYAQSGIQVEKSKLTVRTSTLEVKFAKGAIISLRNRLTDEEYIQRPGATIFDLTATTPLPGGATVGEWTTGEEPDGTRRATLSFTATGRNLSLIVAISPEDEIVLRLSARATAPGVISLTFGILGLNLSPGRMVIPGQAGAYFDANSTPDFVGLDYPVHWENQMLIYEGGRGSFLFYGTGEKPRYQRLRANRQIGSLDLVIETFATAPFADATEVETREWRLAGFGSDWREPAARYKAILQRSRPFVPAEGARDWIREIRSVVMFLNSDTVLLDRLAKELIPSKTLIHFVDWRKQPFDFYYPDYAPAATSGEFIAHAHKLGFRVMLHTNVLGLSEVHPNYRKFSEYQMKRADDRKPIGWLWEEFAPGHPRRVAYISPASSAFRKLFIDSLRPAIEELKPDAIHLDAGGAMINDGNGLIEGMNSMEGMIQLHKELIDTFPQIVWGGESTNEIIGPYNWLAQRWASYSSPHPVSNFLLGDQILSYGFLDQPPPDEPHHLDYLKKYESQGVIPVVVLTNAADLGPDRAKTFDLLARSRRWQEKQYRPDWSSKWTSDLFRFQSADGASTASIEATGQYVQLQENGETVYRRVRNSNQATTPFFIDYWPAYDENMLFGLDPTREYWLTREPFRPAPRLSLRKMPENFRIGTGSLAHSRYAYFEIEPVQKQWFDFIASFGSAQAGTLYDGKNYGLVNGAYVTVSRAIVGGELRNSVLVALPPSRGNINGATFIDYTVPVPMVPNARLAFEAGVVDGPGKSDGVLFGVQIDGVTLWRQNVQPGKWQPGSIDLTPYAGKTVTVRYLTNAGPQQNARFDWPCWGSLNLETSFDIPSVSLAITLPAGGKIRGLSDGATLDEGAAAGSAAIRTALPARVTVFAEEPPAIALGESLLDFPYEVWKSSYEGLPFPFSVEDSGNIDAARSGGVTRAKTLIAVPPRNGFTIITSAVRIPQDANTLEVEYGLIDPPASYGPDFEYSGAEFSLQINGKSVFAEEIRTAGWRARRVPVDSYRGKRVLIQFKVDAQKLSLYDWARWTNLTVR